MANSKRGKLDGCGPARQPLRERVEVFSAMQRRPVIACQVPSNHLDVIGSRQPKLMVSLTMSAGENRGYPRKSRLRAKRRFERSEQSADGRFQGNHDVSVGRSGGAAVIIAEVDAGNGNARCCR